MKHPAFKNASMRYRSRSKVTGLGPSKYSNSNLQSNFSENESTMLQKFKERCINFLDPKGGQELYIYSNPTSPKHGSSRRAITAKLFNSRPINQTINPSLSSPHQNINIPQSRNKSQPKKTNITVNAYDQIMQSTPEISKLVELLKSESNLQIKAECEKDPTESASDTDSQSIISIQKRYNQSSQDKHLNTEYDPNTITDKLQSVSNNEESKLYSSIHKRHMRSSEKSQRNNIGMNVSSNNFRHYDL